MARGEAQETGRGRTIAVAAAMAGVAGLIAQIALTHGGIEWLRLVFAAITGVAGIGLTRRSLVAQVVSRGAAWIVLLPSLFAAVYSLLHGKWPPFEIGALAAGTGLALLVARPMLHTDTARAAFAPKAFRRWFLAGCTAMAATGFVAGGIAVDSLAHGAFTAAAACGALTASLFASAIAVLRMRAWGILLGAVTSVVLLLGSTLVARGGAIALAATPALFLHLLPVLVARIRASTMPPVRAAAPLAERPHAPAPCRVAVSSLEDLDAETSAPEERPPLRCVSESRLR